LLIRTAAGPLRPLASAAYRGLARAAATYLRWRRPAAAVYVTRGVAAGDVLPGVSDLDIAVVVPDDPGGSLAEHDRIKRRWRRVIRALPLVGTLAEPVIAYEQTELRAAFSSTILTYGLESSAGTPATAPAAMFGIDPPHDEAELRARPGVVGPAHDWRLIAGPERRPAPPAVDRQRQRIAAWLELQYWWREAFHACANPERPWAAYTCAKMVAEPARIWLALDGELPPPTREEVLRAAGASLPEEREAFARALELIRELPRSPRAPLSEFLGYLVRLSSRIAERIADEIKGEDRVEVRIGRREGCRLALPLAAVSHDAPLGTDALTPFADWRAVAVPSLPDEALAVIEGNADDPRFLVDAARAAPAGIQPVLQARELLFLPVVDAWRQGLLRCLQAPFSDPVSFATLSASETARFPAVGGWSARDWARRAVAEHAGWLRRGTREIGEPTPREWIDGAANGEAELTLSLAKLLTAARAGLFLQSLDELRPELAVTVEDAARELAESGHDPAGAAGDAADAYRATRLGGTAPPGEIVEALRELVLGLPAYSAVRVEA
jgi:predicted nucleotidyltransferase